MVKKYSSVNKEKRSGSAVASETALKVVFCDIGDILGTAVLSPPPPHLESLDVFPYVAEMLEHLQSKGIRLGIISNTGEETASSINNVLKKSGLSEYFEKDLLIYSSVVHLKKNSPEIFRLAALKAGLSDTPEQCIFVGEDPRERSFATQAGFKVSRDLSLIDNVITPFTLISKPDISNLAGCIQNSKAAALDADTGPGDPTEYSNLLGRLEACRSKLPPLYRDTVYKPFVDKLNEIGQNAFNTILLKDPRRENTGGLMMDIAQSILQNGELYNDIATDAFEEVISDLYDGFLSSQDRKGIKSPDLIVVPPLVKWGNPDFGPYTWPIDATHQAFNVRAAVVNLPPSNARHGLLAWSALGHETAGHDILHADDGLEEELSQQIQLELKKQNIGFGLDDYWSSRIDETASDAMGILNMGPAAAIGLIGYFRGLNAAYTGKPKLRSDGPKDDPHPADILRGYLGASVVQLLGFDGASAWANIIEQETNKDVGVIKLNGVTVSPKVAHQSAEIVAGVLTSYKSRVLQGHALIEIQDWRNADEEKVSILRKILTTNIPLPLDLTTGLYAAHVVAAAVMEALSKDSNIPIVFSRMISILKAMHDQNPSWGPLFIVHPSTITRDLAYRF
jgi:hypothetical protein